MPGSEPSAPARAPANSDVVVRAQLPRNFVALGADYALFLIGLSFASQTTILPAFAVHLGAPNVLIGGIPAILTTGWLLPSLFAAGYTEALTRRLPFVLRYTIWERVPFLGLALAAFLVAERAPALALGTVLLSLVIIAAFGGVLMPAWMDVVGRTVPTEVRGRFFAVWSTVASLGGLAGSFVTGHVLVTVAAPASYGICFLVSALFMGLSYAALAATREPEVLRPAPRTSLVGYLRRVPRTLARDANFAWFLGARALTIVAAMATAFYTVYALRVHGATGWHVGLFTGLYYGGQVAGNAVFGSLADRTGHRLVLLIGAAALLGANLVAVGAAALSVYMATFVLVGLHQASVNVSVQTVLLEFAPTLEERPTYIGLGNTSVAPIALTAPLVAGLIADLWGFEPVFVAGAVAGLGGVGLLAWRVRDPRAADNRRG